MGRGARGARAKADAAEATLRDAGVDRAGNPYYHWATMQAALARDDETPSGGSLKGAPPPTNLGV